LLLQAAAALPNAHQPAVLLLLLHCQTLLPLPLLLPFPLGSGSSRALEMHHELP
jgi:hypothetical protein